MRFLAACVIAPLVLARPAAAEPPIDRAVAAILDARFDEARALLGDLARAHPADPAPVYWTASACWWSEMAKDPDGSGAACLPAIDAAIAKAREAVKASKDDARAHLYLGRALGLKVRHKLVASDGVMSSVGDMRRGYAELSRAEELNPALRVESVEMGLYQYVAGRLPALAKLVRVLLFLPGGDVAQGLARLEDVSRHGGPAADEALLYLAVIDIRYEGQPDRGCERLAQLAARYPHGPHFLNEQARALRVKLHQPEEALAVYARARTLAQAGSAAERMAKLGEALCRADLVDLDSARLLLRELGSGEDRLAAEAWGHLAVVELYRGDAVAATAALRELERRGTAGLERVRDDARKLLAKPPAGALLAYAQAMSEAANAKRQGQARQALAAYRRALGARPGDARALSGIAETQLAAGDGEAAASSFAQLEALPATPLEVTARALLRLGQFDDAAGRRAASLARYSSLVTMPGLPGLRAEARRCLEHPCAITR